MGKSIMKIKVCVMTRKVGSMCEDEFEIDDHATEEEIDKIAQELMWEMIDWNWKRIDE